MRPINVKTARQILEDFTNLQKFFETRLEKVAKARGSYHTPTTFEWVEENKDLTFSTYMWGETHYYTYPLSDFFKSDEELDAISAAREEAERKLKEEQKAEAKARQEKNRREQYEKLQKEFG